MDVVVGTNISHRVCLRPWFLNLALDYNARAHQISAVGDATTPQPAVCNQVGERLKLTRFTEKS